LASIDQFLYLFRRKDDSLLTGSISAKTLTIQGVPHIVSVIHDITLRKLAEEALRESEQLYRSILNASPDDITITDLNGSILVFSPAAQRMFGYDPEKDKIIGSQVLEYIVPEDRDRAKANITNMFKGIYTGPNEYHGVRKGGSLLDIEVNSALIQGSNHQPAKMVFVIRDIRERKRGEQKIQQLMSQLEIKTRMAQLNANTDSLTMLANRRYFDEALSAELQRLKLSGTALSLIMLDVDHFKKFNDYYGHVAGDECLRHIGSTLLTFVRQSTDIVARYGGEEFVAILTGTDQRGAEILAERIRNAIEALAIPNAGSDVSNFVTVSLGVVTVFPVCIPSEEQLVTLADEAMYFAKEAGRNRVAISGKNSAASPDD